MLENAHVSNISHVDVPRFIVGLRNVDNKSHCELFTSKRLNAID